MALTAAFATTREALHALACYVVSPARKARTGRIGLRPIGDGFGTPQFDDGTRIVVRGNALAVEPGEEIVDHHGAGRRCVPRGRPQRPTLASAPTSPRSSPTCSCTSTSMRPWRLVAGTGWDSPCSTSFRVIWAERAAAFSEAQLWPEHFDLAVDVELVDGRHVNIGFSPGDGFLDEPYVYVGPQDMTGLDGDFWNASFGAYLPYSAMDESPAGRGRPCLR